MNFKNIVAVSPIVIGSLIVIGQYTSELRSYVYVDPRDQGESSLHSPIMAQCLKDICGIAAKAARVHIKALHNTSLCKVSSEDVLMEPSPAPVATVGSSVSAASFSANWSAVRGANGYRLDVSADSKFTSFLKGYKSRKVSATTKMITGLSPGKTYYYRVRSVNSKGEISTNSNIVVVITLTSNVR